MIHLISFIKGHCTYFFFTVCILCTVFTLTIHVCGMTVTSETDGAPSPSSSSHTEHITILSLFVRRWYPTDRRTAKVVSLAALTDMPYPTEDVIASSHVTSTMDGLDLLAMFLPLCIEYLLA